MTAYTKSYNRKRWVGAIIFLFILLMVNLFFVCMCGWGAAKAGAADLAYILILIRLIVGAYKGQNYKIAYMYLVLMVAIMPLVKLMAMMCGGH